MLEFTFKKEAIKKMIDAADDPGLDLFVVRLDFSHGANGKFEASITAQCEGPVPTKPDGRGLAAASGAAGVQAIDGCPRPPGCP